MAQIGHVRGFFPAPICYLDRLIWVFPPRMPTDPLRRLDSVARHLPFGVLDFDAANDAFARWRASGEREHQRDVDLWAYCYVQRYFTIRFARERGTPSEVETCISLALQRIRKGYGKVTDPLRFASYASVACKNTLRNHRRDRRTEPPLPEQLAAREAEDLTADLDLELIRHHVRVALRAVPRAPREVAALRFLEGAEYDEIADRLGLELPTVRTYASRAAALLREDDRLRALYYDDLLPPGALPDAAQSGTAS